MKVSTRTRYGLRAIIRLAQVKDNSPLQVKVIADDQDLSIKYLEQLMAILKSAGFVRSVRGSKGGYLLARSPETITAKEVFDVLEGRLVPVECLETNDFCGKTNKCPARWLWATLQNTVDDVLESVTLKDLVDRNADGGTINYQI